MTKSKITKKIMTLSVAAAMLSSFAISAIAEEPETETTPPVTETETETESSVDWASYNAAADSLYDKLTADERSECDSCAAKYSYAKSKLEDAGYPDCGEAIYQRAYFVKMEELVKKNHSKDAIIKNIYTAVRQMYQEKMKEVGNEADYDIYDALVEMENNMPLSSSEATLKASNGDLTEEEFDAIRAMHDKFLEFSTAYQKAFENVFYEYDGILNSDIENSSDVKADVKLFKKQHKVLAKGVDEITLEDADAVKEALDEYDALSSSSKYALSEEKEALDALKAKIDELQAEADAKAAEEEAAKKAAEEEAARKAAEEEAARKVAEEAAKTVSDSDVQTPDDGATSGGKEDTKPVSDSDATSGDAATTDDKDKDKDKGKDKGKDKDSVTDIETGEADYMIPSLLSMASSALGYAGMIFKKKKIM